MNVYIREKTALFCQTASMLFLFFICCFSGCSSGYEGVSTAMKNRSTYVGESGTALGPVDIDGDLQSDGTAIDFDSDGIADGLDTDGDGIIDADWKDAYSVMSDGDAVLGDRTALSISYSGTDSAESVTGDLILSASGQNGSIITWENYESAYAAADGTVTRPFADNEQVTLTAEITKNDVTLTKTFVLTVIAYDNPAAPVLTGGNQKIDVSWQSVETAQSYSVYYSTSEYPEAATLFAAEVTATEASITGLTNYTDYYVWIRAANTLVVSDYSPGAVTSPFLPVTSGSSGFVHLLAVTEDGDLYACGVNAYGQLGDGTIISESSFNSFTDSDYFTTPIKISAFDGNVASVSAGFSTSMAVTTDGDLYAWGNNTYGQLGDGTIEDRTTPVKITAFDGNVAAVSTGYATSMAVTTDGDLYAWGDNTYGQLGDGTIEDRITPVKITAFDGNAASVSTGWVTSMAVTTDGDLYAWGNNAYGQFGDGTTDDSTTPVKITAFDGNVVSVTGDFGSIMAVTREGDLYVWGNNEAGQLGDGTTTDVLTPVLSTGLDTTVSAVYTGGFLSMLVTAENRGYGWGLYNNYITGSSDDYDPVELILQ